MAASQSQPKAAKAANPELTAFVREARKMGITDQDIRSSALKEGWKAEVVDEILGRTGHTRTGSVDAPATPPLGERPRPADGIPDTYQIGNGDVLQISVWKEPDVSVGSVVVRPDGKIAVPLLKEVDVFGLTPAEVEERITERLSKVIRTPDVTVIVTQINSKKIYVIGAVKNEGPIPIRYRMTVLQALTEAGGLTDYAKRKKIYVLRNDGGRQYRLPFNYEEVIRGERIEQNIWIQPDDTIVVPQ